MDVIEAALYKAWLKAKEKEHRRKFDEKVRRAESGEDVRAVRKANAKRERIKARNKRIHGPDAD